MEGLKIDHFGAPFSLPFLGPSFEEPFGPPWPPKVPTLASPCRFWTLFSTPLGSKMAPWGTRVPQNRAQNGSWRRPVSRRGPESHSYRFWDPPGWPRRLFGTPLGDRRCVWGTPLGDKALIPLGILPSAQHNLTQPNPIEHNTAEHYTVHGNTTKTRQPNVKQPNIK